MTVCVPPGEASSSGALYAAANVGDGARRGPKRKRPRPRSRRHRAALVQPPSLRQWPKARGRLTEYDKRGAALSSCAPLSLGAASPVLLFVLQEMRGRLVNCSEDVGDIEGLAQADGCAQRRCLLLQDVLAAAGDDDAWDVAAVGPQLLE
jgi:hypothetical protein